MMPVTLSKKLLHKQLSRTQITGQCNLLSYLREYLSETLCDDNFSAKCYTIVDLIVRYAKKIGLLFSIIVTNLKQFYVYFYFIVQDMLMSELQL